MIIAKRGKKEKLVDGVKKFLENHTSRTRPLLLGFSGGPDSMALLYLLLECQKLLSFELHLAHVDHGWREESLAQALELKKEAERLRLPFHLCRLEKGEKNLEDQCRRLRLNYFLELASQYFFEAVLLAHHADDQAETVLKRLFEGAHLSSLGGLREVTVNEGLKILRPLLKVHKKELLEFVEKRDLKPIYDPTNLDPKFLRGRMRKDLLPLVASHFGKEISSNLCYFGSSFQELKDYFQKRVSKFIQAEMENEEGFSIDFTPFYPLEKVEIKFFIKELIESKKLFLSREEIEFLTDALVGSKKSGKIKTKKGVFVVKSGYLSFKNDATHPFQRQIFDHLVECETDDSGHQFSKS